MPPHLTPSPSTTPPAHALLPHSQSLQTPRPLSCAFSPFYSRLPHLQTLLPLFLRVYPPSLQSCSRGGYFNPLIKNGSKNRPLIYCGLGRQLVQYLLIYTMLYLLTGKHKIFYSPTSILGGTFSIVQRRACLLPFPLSQSGRADGGVYYNKHPYKYSIFL